MSIADEHHRAADPPRDRLQRRRREEVRPRRADVLGVAASAGSAARSANRPSHAAIVSREATAITVSAQWSREWPATTRRRSSAPTCRPRGSCRRRRARRSPPRARPDPGRARSAGGRDRRAAERTRRSSRGPDGRRPPPRRPPCRASHPSRGSFGLTTTSIEASSAGIASRATGRIVDARAQALVASIRSRELFVDARARRR